MLLGLQDVGARLEQETRYRRDDARPVRAGDEQPPDVAVGGVRAGRGGRTCGVPPGGPAACGRRFSGHGYQCAASVPVRGPGARARDQTSAIASATVP